MNINRILFTGNLTADPELVDTGKTKVVNATLAGNGIYYDQEEERQKVTTFVACAVLAVHGRKPEESKTQGNELVRKR